jgi:hypothetical protein
VECITTLSSRQWMIADRARLVQRDRIERAATAALLCVEAVFGTGPMWGSPSRISEVVHGMMSPRRASPHRRGSVRSAFNPTTDSRAPAIRVTRNMSDRRRRARILQRGGVGSHSASVDVDIVRTQSSSA